MRAVIVDDEPPARELVQEYLEDVSRINVVEECGTGREAIEAINEEAPDLVFLDVQMPGLDGFDVLEQIEVLPDIIFSTAYDEYAIQAFDAGAVDYLLKPYSRGRLQKAIERALERPPGRRRVRRSVGGAATKRHAPMRPIRPSESTCDTAKK